MQHLFERYFWALRWMGIAALAWVVSGGINDELAARLFALPAHDPLAIDGAPPPPPFPAWGRVAPEEDAAEQLSARHVFDLDPPAPPAPAPPAEPAKPDAPEPHDGDELAETELAIALLGTLVTTEAAGSVATLEVAGRTRLGWRGSALLDGQATIVRIAPRHVVLEEAGGERTVVMLWDDDGGKKAGPPPARNRGAHPTARSRDAASSVNDRMARRRRIRRAVHRNGAYDYTVERAMLDEELKDPALLASEARATPSYDGGALRGVKLVGVRPGSLYRALGLRSGDVVTAIDGRPLTSASRPVDLLQQLGRASTVSVAVARRGRDTTLTYSVR
ncbi:MAG: hypothetical protein EP329_24955 [Deltaproteobacteria bacterium]|nr:MAG: hypothetical protein EP329_24955 [Deltaproteobacteria bacterium]